MSYLIKSDAGQINNAGTNKKKAHQIFFLENRKCISSIIDISIFYHQMG